MTMLDLDKLVAPIREDAPCGQSIESDETVLSIYREMNSLYNAARLIQKSRVELESLASSRLRSSFRSDKADRPDDPVKTPNWDEVLDRCFQLLYHYSKDARVVGRLFEPITRTEGVEGLVAALQGALSLMETYGSELHPHSEEDPLAIWQHLSSCQNSETFMDSLNWMRIDPKNPVCFGCKFRMEVILKLSSLTDEDISELKNSEYLDEAEFQIQLKQLQPQDVEAFMGHLSKAVELSEAVDATLVSKAPNTEFRFSRVHERLNEIYTWFQKILPGAGLIANATPAEASPTVGTASSGNPSGIIVPATSAASREEALRQLKQVADFFRKTEPHSPLSYALEQTVRWGGMTLPDLLKDFIDNTDVLSDVYRRMGIQEKQE